MDAIILLAILPLSLTTVWFSQKVAMKSLFITGGDGFLGVNLLEILTQRGYDITVMVQPGRNAAHLERFPIKTVEGDLTSYDSLYEAMKGADVVMHLAAVATVWPSRHPIYWKVNVEGTRNMIKAAQAHKVERFIHVGSARSVFEPGTPERPGTELDRTPAIDTGFEYADSKRDGQLLVEKAAREENFPAIILAPTFMIGPQDAKPSTGQLLMAVWSGKLPIAAPGGKNYIDIRDAATAMANAIDKGRLGEVYLLGNENLDYKEATQLMAAQVGVKAPGFVAPKWLLLLAGAFGSFTSRFTGKPPFLTIELARISCEHQIYDASKAVRELEMPQTPIAEAFQDSIGWFRDNGTFERLYPKYKYPLAGKVIWVTGAGHGLGKTIALRLADAGARIVLNDQDETSLQQTADQFRRMSLEAMAIPGVPGDNPLAEVVLQKIGERFGKLDALVNCQSETLQSDIYDLEVINQALGKNHGYGLNVQKVGASRPASELKGNWGSLYYDLPVPDKGQDSPSLDLKMATRPKAEPGIANVALKMILKQDRQRFYSGKGSLATFISAMSPTLMQIWYKGRIGQGTFSATTKPQDNRVA